jgi:dTDP-4-amino-4,6-dideoxygalactose transaminase
MAKINRLATEHGLRVIEDAAQAHGAGYQGRRAGGLGRAAAWSFYPAKNLGALSDGGAITTNDSNLAAAARLLRNYGSPSKYMHDVRGVNSRLDEIQSAVLRVKLQRLDEWNERRRSIASLYLDGLRDTEVTLTAIADGADPVWHLFVVRHSRRDELMSALAYRGIDCLIHYPLAPHLQRAYEDLNLPPGSFPIAEQLQGEVLSLPIGPHITATEAQRVVSAVRDIAG